MRGKGVRRGAVSAAGGLQVFVCVFNLTQGKKIHTEEARRKHFHHGVAAAD